MAASINNNEEYGHDAMFVDEVLEEHKCAVCHLVLRDPLQIMTCGHRFCSPCFNRMKIHAQQTDIDLTCPVDREVVATGQVFPDRGIARSIGNLKTKCENVGEGCDWVGDLRDLQKHQGECTYRMAQHLNHLYLQDGNQVDQKLLLDRILMRLQKCEESLIAREERLEKFENDLMSKEKDIAHCKVTIDEMKDDAKVREQDIKLLKDSNLRLQGQVNSLTEKNGELIEKVKIACEARNKEEALPLKTKVDALYQDLEKVNRTLEALDAKSISTKLETCEKEIRKSNEKLISLEQLKDERSAHLANLENISFSRNSFDPNGDQDIELRWVMGDFKKKLTQGGDVYSPKFYTSVEGYCFKLHVQWTGPRKGKLDLFLQLCRDKSYEHPLKPFNHEYTFGIIDKYGHDETGKVDLDDILKYPSRFILKDGEDEAGLLGCESMLTAPFSNWVINDALFITCTIHM